LADHCNPEFSSEPLVGYNTCRSIVEQVDEAVVVTQIRNREAIERAGMAGAEVVYLDTEYIARPIWKISKALRLPGVHERSTDARDFVAAPRTNAAVFHLSCWRAARADQAPDVRGKRTGWSN
jgi:hypothetical protein